MKQPFKTILYVSLFAIAMGFMESAIVIYLRELYYKEGFNFPLKPMPVAIAIVELLREAATIIMLIIIGYLAGKTKLQRFAYFNVAFAIWDIFYYIFLYIFLGWPQSLSTWDILFLIPLPWVGPVWAPCLLSLLMLVGSLFTIFKCEKNHAYRIAPIHWFLLITGALVCILSFIWDYFMYYHHINIISSERKIFDEVSSYIPSAFNFSLFFSGLLLMSIPVFYNIFNSIKLSNR